MITTLRSHSAGYRLQTALCSVMLSALLGSSAIAAEPAASGSSRDEAPATPQSEPAQLPPELQAIQRSLGGSTLNQFPSLRDDAGPLRARLQAGGRERSAARGLHRDAIRALRDAAAQLDMSANRLESLELYPQADAMRQLAQQMRVDARAWAAGGDPAVGPTPTAPHGEPTRAMPQPRWDSSMPQLQPSTRPDVPIAPETQTSPADSGALSPLEPMPEPENRDNPPKPQPLLDSPQASPRPDVEIEG